MLRYYFLFRAIVCQKNNCVIKIILRLGSSQTNANSSGPATTFNQKQIKYLKVLRKGGGRNQATPAGARAPSPCRYRRHACLEIRGIIL